MTGFWLKLYIEFLDDIKIGELPEYLQLRFIKLLLVAKEYDQDGKLPPVSALAWRLRTNAESMSETLSALGLVGVVQETTPGSWLVVNFAKRQAHIGASNERVKRYRQNRNDLGMPANYTYSHQEILKRDGHKCVYCGSTDNLCVDHMFPTKQGGTDDLNNLACACKICNSGKSGRTPEQAGFRFMNTEAESRYLKYVTVTRNHTEIEEEIEEEIEIEGSAGDPFFTQIMTLTGLLATANDLTVMTKWEQEGVVPDDIRDALQWRKDNGKPPVKTIGQLAGGIDTARRKRIQGENAKPGSGGKPTLTEQGWKYGESK